MVKLNPLLLTDFYKVHHNRMYPKNTVKIYSNLTPRKSRIKGVDKVVVFGIQYMIKEYLINQFSENFFKRPLYEILEQYRSEINVDTKHIENLWRLGYLPIKIKALREGTLSKIGVPILTITNTDQRFFWLVNYLETLISTSLWQSITSATIAHEYKKLLLRFADETGADPAFVPWQGHDFSMRGMSSVESAILSGMGHLLSFTGTDTIPAIYALKHYYDADGLVGASVPATEHSVMSMGQKDNELETFKNLLDLYPTGILSVVSDTWNLWTVLTEYLSKLKAQIMKRDGKLVIRPDSGDPADILCGVNGELKEFFDAPIRKGVVELLWDEFGGTINEKGYKVLDSHIGAIYGDSITLEKAEEILTRLKEKGFASSNVVLGIGSYTYQYNTRDTFGFAMKATYGEVVEQVGAWGNGDPIYEPLGREIFKDPITDDGTKKSAKGLLLVQNGELRDQVTQGDEMLGDLKTVFLDGRLTREQTLTEIRDTLAYQEFGVMLV